MMDLLACLATDNILRLGFDLKTSNMLWWVGHSQPTYWFTIRDVFSLVINVFILLSSNATHTKFQDFKGNLKTSYHSRLEELELLRLAWR